MSRSRNATLTFGLMTLGVKLSSAKDKPVEMKNLCVGQPGKEEHAGIPVKAPKRCDECGEITDYNSLVKGIPNGDEFTVVTQDDVAEAKEEYAEQYKKSLSFVPHPATDFLSQTGPGKSLNYIQPAEAGGADIYQMLLKLVSDRPDLAFVTLHTPSSVTNLFLLTVRNGVLALEERTRTQDLREAPEVGGEVNESLYGMLLASADAMLTPYDPEDYEDGYQKHLKELSEAQATVTDIGTGTRVDSNDADDLRTKLQAMMKGAA